MCWRKRVLLIGFFIMGLFGCREVYRYDYKLIEFDILDGQFIINVMGGYGENYEEKGKKKLDWGAPYSISFEYLVTLNDALTKLEVKGIQLVGEKNASQHRLDDIQSDKIRVYGERKFIRIPAGVLTAEEYEYQNYRLKATVIIYKTTTEFEEKTIDVLLETDYSRERRSDKFDEIMSV